VSPAYFTALRVPLVHGRLFTDAENRADRPPVVVVNEEFVKRYFPSEEVIGRRIKLGISHDTAEVGDAIDAGGEIIGVVKNVKDAGMQSEPFPTVYLAFNTLPLTDLSFVMRTTADPATLQNVVRARVHEVDPNVPIYDLKPMTQYVSESVGQPRFYALLLGSFAFIALLLAALGIYGVISYAVTQRSRELGIRIAIGATRERIVALVLQQGMAPTALGVVAGMVAAAWLTRVISSLLFGVSALDPVTMLSVPALLAGVAIVACLIPARRAARVDPAIAMRVD
jgi:putative ABC transport system permease protein